MNLKTDLPLRAYGLAVVAVILAQVLTYFIFPLADFTFASFTSPSC